MVIVIFYLQETKKQLDLDYILDKIMVQTPYGKKLKKDLKLFRAEDEAALLVEFERLEKTKAKVEKFKVTYKEIRGILSHFKSLDLTLERIYNSETLSVTELFEIKGFVLLLRKLDTIITANPERGVRSVTHAFKDRCLRVKVSLNLRPSISTTVILPLSDNI